MKNQALFSSKDKSKKKKMSSVAIVFIFYLVFIFILFYFIFFFGALRVKVLFSNRNNTRPILRIGLNSSDCGFVSREFPLFMGMFSRSNYLRRPIKTVSFSHMSFETCDFTLNTL